MPSGEDLQAMYRELSSDRLHEIATSSSDDFTPEAVAAAQMELERRGVAPSAHPAASSTNNAPPTRRPVLVIALGLAALGVVLVSKYSQPPGADTDTFPPGFEEPACDSSNFAECDQACTAGKAAACNSLGIMYQGGFGTRKNEAEAASVFERACELGNANGCSFAGSAYSGNLKEPTGLDPEKGHRLTKKACEMGVAESCVGLGSLLEFGKGTTKNLARAIEFYRDGCRQKIGSGCTFLGYCYEDGRGVAKDEKEAARLYEKACERSDQFDQNGCYALAVMLDQGRAIKADKKRARSIFLDLCRKYAVAGACKEAGIADPFAASHNEHAKTVSTSELECGKGDPGACYVAGSMYRSGIGVEKDIGRALQYLGIACQADFARACYSMGHIYEDGAGYGFESEVAKPLFEKACKLGEPLACRWLEEPWDL